MFCKCRNQWSILNSLCFYILLRRKNLLSLHIPCRFAIDRLIHFRNHCFNPLARINRQFIPIVFYFLVVEDFQVVHFTTRYLYIPSDKYFQIFSLLVELTAMDEHVQKQKVVYTDIQSFIHKNTYGVFTYTIYHNKPRCSNLQ